MDGTSLIATNNVGVVNITVSILDLLASKVLLNELIIGTHSIIGAVTPSRFGVTVSDASILRIILCHQVGTVGGTTFSEDLTVVLEGVELSLRVGVYERTGLNYVIATTASG